MASQLTLTIYALRSESSILLREKKPTPDEADMRGLSSYRRSRADC